MTETKGVIPPLSLIAALALTTFLAAPAAAGFVGVSRCNVAGGSNEPALHIVDGGNR